jgi:sulfatase maturation enzyme AslB (radical SAM superfamily)
MSIEIKSSTFCMHPFTGLATREDGAIKVCCRSHPIGDINKQTLEEIWNGDAMKLVRYQVLNNGRPDVCAPCFNLEDQGVESLRQRHIKGEIPESRINLYPNAMKNLQQDKSMTFEIPTMELKLNNLCNLKCRMCHPGDSTSWNDWDEIKDFYKNEGHMIFRMVEENNLSKKPMLDSFENNPNWWDSLEKNLKHFRRVEFAGGEPLMDPQHYKILDKLMPYGKNIEIKYATNLTTLGIKGKRNIHEYWPNFKSIAVNVSIDGIGDVYEYIRGNSNWNELIRNVKEIQKISNINRIVGAVAVQVSNVLILDQMIEYFLDDLGIVFYTNMVNHPNVLSAQVLPEELKELAIQRLKTVATKVNTFKLVKQHPMLLNLTLGQINGVINFLSATDQSHLWQDCLEFNRRLDVTRKQSFTGTTPEFKPYV